LTDPFPDGGLEAQVRDYIAAMAEVKPEKVQLATRLLDDLGIDGDDAVELFKGLHERFGTDFAPLYERWGDHFGPEDIGCATALVFLPGLGVGGIIGTNFGALPGIAVAAALVALSLWLAPKLGLGPDIKPITVAEVIEAVKTRSWPA
jgi:hypothetical protein